MATILADGTLGTQPGANLTNSTVGDPTATFLTNISSIIKDAQIRTNNINLGIGQAKGQISNTNSMVGPGTGYQGAAAQAGDANQNSWMNSFTPATASLNDIQTQNNQSLNTAAGLANADIGLMKGQFSTYQDPYSGKIMRVNNNTGQVTDITSGDQVGGNVEGSTISGLDNNHVGIGTPDKSTTISTSTGLTIDVYGGTNGVGNYAGTTKQDAIDYATKVQSIYDKLSHYGQYQSTTQPVPASALGLDTYIKTHASGAPVTGTMIMAAANAYKIDPNLLAAHLAIESDFGTQGAATKTNNPGNIGNTGSSTKNFNSWQDGVFATAQFISKLDVSNKPTGGSNTQNNTGGNTGNFSTPLQNSINSIVQRVVSGGMSYDQGLAAAGALPSGAAAVNAYLNTLPKGFNTNTSNANATSIGSQTTLINDLSAARQSVGNISNGLIKQIASNGNINPTNLTLVNSLIQKIASNTSDPNYATFINQITDIASTYGQILTPGGNTDSTRNLAQSLVNELASGSTIQQVIASLDQQAQEKILGIQTNTSNLSSGQNVNPSGSLINASSQSPAKGTTITINGVNYVSDGTQWVLSSAVQGTQNTIAPASPISNIIPQPVSTPAPTQNTSGYKSPFSLGYTAPSF